MKKIAVWKVLVFSLITFGIYAIIWLALRRQELLTKHNEKIPHWLWLVVPGATVLFLSIPILVAGWFLVGGDIRSFAIFVVIFMYTAAFMCAVITAWWLWKFGRVAEKEVNYRVTRKWLVLLYLFLGLGALLFLQFYVNRGPTGKNVKSRPSRRFMTLAVCLIILSLGLNIWSLIDMQKQIVELQNMPTATFEKPQRLLKEYNSCIYSLKSDFPGELTEDKAAAYQAAYDKCERIRVEQNHAAEEYNTSLGL